ncbi:MAG: HAD family hydrolase [Bacillota bacterium]|nr:HAD family hydrolase [Bacillota bacterium]
MKPAILFDLDGTLWDATGCIDKIWNRVLEKHENISFRMTHQILNDVMGKTMEEMGKCLFPDLSEKEREQLIDELGIEEVIYLKEHGGILYDGVKEIIPILSKNYDLYIVSNSQDGYVQAFLTAHGMETYFKDIEMSGRTGREKSYNIQLIMQRNQIEKAYFVGDTRFDQEASLENNLPFIYCSYGFGKDLDALAKIDSFKDLPALLETL